MVVADAERDLIGAVRAADAGGEPVLLIGGGSNLVISDDGLPRHGLHVEHPGIGYVDAGDGAGDVTVAAGEDWDASWRAAVAEGLAGLECLSGIPGRAGATPIQNVGAYGQRGRRGHHRGAGVRPPGRSNSVHAERECVFAYRTSLFKAPDRARRLTGRLVVLDVTFRLTGSRCRLPVRYAELAAELGRDRGGRGPGRGPAAVLKIRARKGMVLNPGDPDTRSAGSFFTNPVISVEELARVETAAARPRRHGPVPRYDRRAGLVKVPAAWLIEHAGFAKGYGVPVRRRVSSKHTLALINTGDATTADLLALAREIVAGVHAAYGVTLAHEPVLVGVTL